MMAWQIAAVSLGSAMAAQISDRNLLLPPASTVELSARPGGCVWESERPEVASVGAVRCEGGVSYATVTTHAPPQTSEIVHRRPALITAVPREGEATEELLSCQVNVGLIRSLRISTTTKYMIANELQWLRVSAEDDAGNLFSEAGVRSLAFDWRFEPEGFVTLIPPAQTLQQLPPELAALSESEARAYYTVPVHATAAPKRDEVRVRATLGAGHASAGAVTAEEVLHVSPPLLLSPAERVALPPGAALQYALWKRTEGRARAPPYAVAPAQATSRGHFRWAAAPAGVAAVAEGGMVLARQHGTASLTVTQSLDRATAELLVAPPHSLSLELAGAAAQEAAAGAAAAGAAASGGEAAAEGERLLQQGQTYYIKLQMLAAPAEGASDGAAAAPLPLLIADAAGEFVLAAERSLAQLRPR